MNISTRRKARECALQILYQVETVSTHQPSEAAQGNVTDLLSQVTTKQLDAEIDHFFDNFEAKESVYEYASMLVHETIGNIKQIDSLIETQSAKWKLERMARVDRNIMRIAVYELLHKPDLATNIIIDEAVEIAKKYGSEQSASFVNGV